jgi:hypothetical protein
MRTTNKNARECVVKLKPFTASNLSATLRNGFYVVYSYGWYPLFAYSIHDLKWYENEERYSVSTSRQKSQSHPQQETVKLSHEGLKDLIAKGGVWS